MKFATFRLSGEETDRVGVKLDDGLLELVDASGATRWPSLLALIEGGERALDDARAVAENRSGRLHAMDTIALRAPIPLPPQYRDAMCFHQHIRQSFPTGAIIAAHASGDDAAVEAATAAAKDFEIPAVHSEIPVYYKGNRFAVGHPGQTVVWPSYSRAMDFELELACVIGTGGRDIGVADAHDHIFGYTILNDLSARDAQGQEMRGLLGPAKGKDFDNANVFGPYLVTADEIGDPYTLRMSARVNGELWGEGHSSDMHWSFADLIARISAGETLYPGEIIGSGTVGNGCGLEHMRLLQSGDHVALEIERVGVLENTVRAHPDHA